jgi:CHRD domain-containing protein
MESLKQVSKTFAIVIISLLVFLVALNPVNANQQDFRTSLNGSQEIPSNNSSATGLASFKVIGNNSVQYEINVTGLDKVMEAHLHLGKIGTNGDPIVMLFNTGPTGPINGTLISDKFSANDFLGPMSGKSITDIVDKMKSGEIYVNIHTGSFPDGELRGQISARKITPTN